MGTNSYKGLSEAEIIRRRGKFSKPKRGGKFSGSSRDAPEMEDEEAFMRRNKLSSSDDDESGSSDEDSSTSESSSSGSDSACDSENKLKGASSDAKGAADSATTSQPAISKKQIKSDQAKLAEVKARREAAAAERLSKTPK